MYVFSYFFNKVDDCKKLGVKDVIFINKDNWVDEWQFKFDFIFNFVDVIYKFDMVKYFGLFKFGGDFYMVGLFDEVLLQLIVFIFVGNVLKLMGSYFGNYQEMEVMLQLVVDKGLYLWVEMIDILEKGCQEVVERVKENKVCYCFMLIGFDKVFGCV